MYVGIPTHSVEIVKNFLSPICEREDFIYYHTVYCEISYHQLFIDNQVAAFKVKFFILFICKLNEIHTCNNYEQYSPE